MNTTISMILGIAFVILGVTAVFLQAWLWNPRYWDPIAKKTNAPRAGLRAHRWVGIAFTVIYVVMMWHMLPRLWEYQVELPARTVAHAMAGIMLGVLLATKLVILRWYRHFEEAMPLLGFGILACTIVLGTLSIPFAVRAQGVGKDVWSEETQARVEQLLTSVDLPDEVSAGDLATGPALERGRKVLVSQCTTCHDLRTILVKPRPAEGWFDISERMAAKPSAIGSPISDDDIPYVTAYLVAITPELQASRKMEMDQQRRKDAMMSTMTPVVAAQPSTVDPFAVPPAEPVDATRSRALVHNVCSQCHELTELDTHGGDTPAGWAKVVRAMIDEGAEIDEPTARILVQRLAEQWPAKP